jgi:cytochrome c-type biogenesis protein CcmH
MMEAIDAQVEAGRTDEEIFTYFRARYGDEVLVEPPREGINLALWWVPVGVLLLGLGVVALYLKDSSALGRRRPQAATSNADAELETLADRVLGEQGKGRAVGRGDAQVESP